MKCFEKGNWKRGVLFIRKIIPKPTLVLVSKALAHHVPFRILPDSEGGVYHRTVLGI